MCYDSDVNLLVHAHSIDLVANMVVPLKFIMSSTFVYIKDMSLFLEFIMIMYVFGTGTIFFAKIQSPVLLDKTRVPPYYKLKYVKVNNSLVLSGLRVVESEEEDEIQ